MMGRVVQISRRGPTYVMSSCKFPVLYSYISDVALLSISSLVIIIGVCALLPRVPLILPKFSYFLSRSSRPYCLSDTLTSPHIVFLVAILRVGQDGPQKLFYSTSVEPGLTTQPSSVILASPSTSNIFIHSLL